MGRAYKTLYKEFLSNVNKRKIGTVIPDEFALLFNLSVEEVYTNKLSMMDANKKVNTDIEMMADSLKGQIMTESLDGMYRCFKCNKPDSIRRIRTVRLLLDNSHNTKCYLITSNNRSEKLDSVYDKPTIKKTYYELSGKEIIVYVPIITTSVKAYIDYYKEPTAVNASKVVSDDICPYTNEFCTEVIEVASRMCIERNQDGRYQTFGTDLKQNKQKNQ